ncbi:MAG: PQQ-dependent sugar dehydrogenase [Gemmatimonadota bacterium]
MAGQRLVRLPIDTRTVKNVDNLVQGMGRIRGLREGPDGFLYIAFEDADASHPLHEVLDVLHGAAVDREAH